jgi:ammonia channel protein AmtB
MICACLVFLMSPALGFFYAGLARAKNALSLMYLTVLSVAVVSFQWYLIGYSLTFSETGGRFIGDSANFLLRGVGMKPALEGQTIPATAYMIFQAMFAALTPALAFGSAAERMSVSYTQNNILFNLLIINSLVLLLFSFLFGQLLFMTSSLAGYGVLTDGYTKWVSWITLVEHLCTSLVD